MPRPIRTGQTLQPIDVMSADHPILVDWFGRDLALICLAARRERDHGRRVLRHSFVLSELQRHADWIAQGKSLRACDNPDYPRGCLAPLDPREIEGAIVPEDEQFAVFPGIAATRLLAAESPSPLFGGEPQTATDNGEPVWDLATE